MMEAADCRGIRGGASVVDPSIATPDSITVNGNGDTHTITVAGDTDKVEYELPDGGSYTETADATGDYKFTITPKATYQIDSVKYKIGTEGADQTVTAGTDGSYTVSIPKSTITDDVTVTVTASKISYDVSVIYTDADVDFTCDALTAGTKAGKIDAGEALSFTAKIKETLADTKEITKVSYKIGADGTDTDLELATNGQYTIPADDINGAVTITVTSEAIPTYDITFSSHANITKVNDIKVNGVAAADITGDSEWKINAKKGATVTFKLTADDKFEVEKVTDAANEEIEAGTDGAYTIENLSEAVTLTVTAALSSAANGFSFAMDTGSDPKTATMTVEAPASDADTAKGLATIAGSYDDGDSKRTLNEKITVSFAAKEGYELGDVKVGGTVVQPTTPAADETPAKYEITLTAGQTTAITVATEAKGSEAAKEFAFDNQADHFTLGPVNADGTAITPAEGKYTAAANTKRITFSLTTEGAYEPVVTAVTKAAADSGARDTTEVIEAVSTKTETGKTTYSYMVLASKLADVYTITETEAEKTLTFEGADNVTVSIDGRLTNVSDPLTYTQGKKMTVKVSAKENVTLNSVAYTVGEAAEVKPKVTNNATEFSLTLSADTTVVIDATGALVALPLKDSEDAEVPFVKGAYSVSYDGTYTAAIGEGTAKALVNPTAAELLSGTKKLDGAGVVTTKDKKVVIDLSKAPQADVSGKKLTLKVTVGAEGAAKTFIYTLQATKAIAAAGDITVKAGVTQPTDTAKSYPVSTKGEIDRLEVKDVAEAITAGYLAEKPYIDKKKGQLVITAGQTPTPAEGTTITVYAGSGDQEISKEVVLKTTPLIGDATKAPKVTLQSATDISLKLDLSAQTDKDEAVGGVYYKIVATATGTAPANLESTVTKYVKKTGDKQPYELKLNKSDKTYGDGDACSYKVAVSLVHAKDKDVEPANAEKTVAEGKNKFETPDNKPFATQAPAWEASLKLKKGKTTIYTGEEDAAIATAQFTKTTTFREIQQANVTDLTYSGDKGLGFTVDGDVIKATATADTAVGKHTVQVVSLADDGVGGHEMVASKATIVVTVVKGINKLGVAVPADSMYKAVNKAATLKATVIYNDDATGRDKPSQPKTKKVKWDVVKAAASHTDVAADEAFGDGKVTVKNGTVTVAKDYVIKADPDENKFQIRVTVDNDKATIGDAKAAYSEAIEITNEGLDMNRLVLVGRDNKVLAVSSVSKAKDAVAVEATVLNSASVKVLTAKAAKQTVGETYTNNVSDTELAYTNMTYKSSKAKDVDFSTKSGALTLVVNKAKTQPVLTLTANDGSKATLAIKLNVGYDTPTGDLALKITNAEDDEIYTPAGAAVTTVEKDYSGSATNTLYAELYQKDGETWKAADPFANYEIKVKSGKKVAQTENGTVITTDKQIVEIELKDKSGETPKTVTYKLKNTAFVPSGASVKAKVIGSLRQASGSDEQDVKLELTIPKDLAATLSGADKDMAVMVDTDWSKLSTKNAEDLETFDESLTHVYTIDGYDPEKQKATVKLTFTGDVEYNQKNYALKVSVGSQAKADSTFTAAAPAAAATVKVEKTKKFTFKPAASYKLATRDSGALVTGKASIPTGDYELTDLSLLNANIGGTANSFKSYFEIVDGKLRIKTDVSEEDIKKLVNDKDYKKHLTGYLTYTAAATKTYYEASTGTGKNTVKITVKLEDKKALAKYTADEVTITNKENETVSATILADKEKVTLAAAMIDPDERKTDACVVANDPLITDGNKIGLKLKEKATKPKVKATVYVVPENSYYASKFAQGQSPKLEDYKAYGTVVTINLKVVEPVTMTLADATAAVTAWVETVKTADPAPEWLTKKDAAEATMKAAVTDEAKKAIVADNAAEFVIAYAPRSAGDSTEDFTFEAAGTTKAGKVSGTLEIKLGADSTEKSTVPFEFIIPMQEEEEKPPVETTPEVTKVEILKDGATVETATATPGENITFTAKVTGDNLTEDTDFNVT